MNKKDESRLTRSRLQKKYNLKNDTPISKLPKIMTPTDCHDYMIAMQYPNGKPFPEHLKEVPTERLTDLIELFKPRL
jgi:hypothetical protein